MIIGIDGNEANVEKRVGISEYAYELLMQFYNFQFSIFNSQFLIYLKDKPRVDLPSESESWKYRVVGPKRLWTQIGLPIDLYLHKPKPSVFFSPTHYAPRFCPVPTCIAIMDLSYIHLPQMFKKLDLFQLQNWTAYSARKAKKIFTISNTSKSDIIKQYKVPEERVIITYPGIKIKTTMPSAKLLKEKYGIESDYILLVGTLQPRKNIVRLVDAFSKIKDLNINLVVVGKKGWLYEDILAAPKKYGVDKRVKFVEFVPEEDLPYFYKKATCFVLPSLYEGFGLPVLEAMQYGCPVITSKVSSLPEAGGDAALYVDPEDVNDIVEKMQSLIENEKLRKMLIDKGYKQVKKFSWEKTARETLRVLQEVANDR